MTLLHAAVDLVSETPDMQEMLTINGILLPLFLSRSQMQSDVKT